ncbi:MAG: virulence protein [Candidatus Cryptobacteroides sp.]
MNSHTKFAMELKDKEMHAIVFDLDTETLKAVYPNSSWNNAYNDICSELEQHGFKRQQGSVYFGSDNEVNAVTCVLAVQALSKKFSWFKPSVRDIRMLKIEDNNDLAPAL